MRRGEPNLVAPLATVIKQRVRCTEAKLIWSFDDKSTTFIPPLHIRRTAGWKEGRKERERKTNRGEGEEMRTLSKNEK